ncbi:hypothetical protein B0H65DRAFT_98183 [Neurospora tetraspora]|uniref:Transmembrane protein n=1 Tax=Neurospora tetraspora TaxID=94610 RepID=A0AAE0JJW8_9PEZI|nr:hypothetical protein B0H65DRAFT_98183 [Neurospora tetraspora]
MHKCYNRQPRKYGNGFSNPFELRCPFFRPLSRCTESPPSPFSNRRCCCCCCCCGFCCVAVDKGQPVAPAFFASVVIIGYMVFEVLYIDNDRESGMKDGIRLMPRRSLVSDVSTTSVRQQIRNRSGNRRARHFRVFEKIVVTRFLSAFVFSPMGVGPRGEKDI